MLKNHISKILAVGIIGLFLMTLITSGINKTSDEKPNYKVDHEQEDNYDLS